MRKRCLLLLACFALLLANSAQAKEWTLLIYIAGDNDLARFGLIDINEMEKVGSTDEVDIVVQFDGSEKYSPGASKSVRLHIERDNDSLNINSPVVDKLGEVNMGQKKTFAKFVKWGVKKYPAKKYAVVLWNHGNGWYEDVDSSGLDFTSPHDVQGIVNAIEQMDDKADTKSVLNDEIQRRRVETEVGKKFHVRPFGGQAPEAEVEDTPFGEDTDDAVCFDQSLFGKAALSTTDIREVLEDVKENLPSGQTIEIVGFDACLMAMVEVFHELRNVANYGIGSQKTEPGDGWAYDRFLPALVANPQMDGKELGKHIVSSYTAHYREQNAITTNAFHRSNTTLCCVDMSQMEILGKTCDLLGQYLTLIMPKSRWDIWSATMISQHCGEIGTTEPHVLLIMTAHRDIIDFARKVAFTFRTDNKCVEICEMVINAAQRAITSFEKNEGKPLLGVTDTYGLSIYLPFLKVESGYGNLEMGRGKWGQFLKVFMANAAEKQQLVASMTGKASKTRQARFNKIHSQTN